MEIMKVHLINRDKIILAVAAILLVLLILIATGQPLLNIYILLQSKSETNDTFERTTLNMWSSNFPDMHIPPSLLGRLSPLHEDDLVRFAGLIDNNALFQNSVEFCEMANLSCNTSIGRFSPSGTVFVIASLSSPHGPSDNLNLCRQKSIQFNQSEALQTEDDVFFHEEALTMSASRVRLPDLHDPAPMKAFLPRILASKFPFSCEGLTDLSHMLNISKHSNMSYNMAMVIKACEAPLSEGQTKQCVTSIEDMLEMVVSTLGSHVEVLSEPNTIGSRELVSVTNVTIVSPTAPLSCHSFVFPFGVYYCHFLQGSQVFKLTLQLEEGTIFERSAVCHAWNPSLAQEFAALHLNSDNKACHWLYGSNLLWVPKSASQKP